MERPPRGPALRATGAFVLGLLLLQALWIVVIPPFDGSDEIDHVYRALTVADGDLLAARRPLTLDEGRGDVVEVRGDVVRAAAPACSTLKVGVHNCVPFRATTPGRVLIGCSAAAYNPVGYLAPALVSPLAHGTGLLYAMRIAGALSCAVVLGVAFWMVARWSRTRWPVLFLLVVVTPTTISLTALSNPSGLHLVLAATLWFALLFAYDEETAARDRRVLLGIAAVAGALMPATHTLGVLWLPAVLATVLAMVGPRRALAQVREDVRAHVVAGAVVAVGWLTSVAWVFLAHTNDPGRVLTHAIGSPYPAVFFGVFLWPLQAVAVFPSRDEPAPLLVYAVWLVLLGGLLTASLRPAGRRARRTALAVFVLVTLVGMVLTVRNYDHLGLAWQGRYSYPYLCGALVVLAMALEWRRAAVPAWFNGALLVACLVLVEVVGMHGVVVHKTALAVWRDEPHVPYPSLLVLGLVGALAAAAWVVALRALPAPERAEVSS